QPPPRPPQSTIPQLTSLLINNAGALGADRSKIIQLRTAKKPMICSKNLGFLIPPDSTRSAVGMLQGLGQTRDVDMRVVRTYRRP
ncbi:hypothetical protein ORA11_24675, partial [Mycobacterium ulcerans]|nr:hypothetical protein [Mycobacterium ulcerans]